jgi:hypothetical protein
MTERGRLPGGHIQRLSFSLSLTPIPIYFGFSNTPALYFLLRLFVYLDPLMKTKIAAHLQRF